MVAAGWSELDQPALPAPEEYDPVDLLHVELHKAFWAVG